MTDGGAAGGSARADAASVTSMLRIYADFNDRDRRGRVVLTCRGSIEDLERHHQHLRSGLRVLLNVQDELEVEATLELEDVWLAEPDMATLRYLAADEA